MKRSLWFLILIILQIISSLFLMLELLTSNQALLILLMANIGIFILLSSEPYWKIGAIIIYMVFVEVMCFVLNVFIFDRFIAIHSIVNISALVLGSIVAGLAFKMNLEEAKYTRRRDDMPKESKKNTPAEFNGNKNEDAPSKDKNLTAEENEILDSEIEKGDEPEKPSYYEEGMEDDDEANKNNKDENSKDLKKVVLKALIYTAKDNTIHTEDCKKLAKIKAEEKTLVGSKRYAQSMKYIACKACKPY